MTQSNFTGLVIMATYYYHEIHEMVYYIIMGYSHTHVLSSQLRAKTKTIKE